MKPCKIPVPPANFLTAPLPWLALRLPFVIRTGVFIKRRPQFDKTPAGSAHPIQQKLTFPAISQPFFVYRLADLDIRLQICYISMQILKIFFLVHIGCQTFPAGPPFIAHHLIRNAMTLHAGIVKLILLPSVL